MLTDIEIAQQAHMLPIAEVAAGIGIDADDLEFYGKYKAKLSDELARKVAGNPDGRLVLVTAINPTPAGEGKTTTSVGLGQAMARIGKKAVLALREPSLGPVFGINKSKYYLLPYIGNIPGFRDCSEHLHQITSAFPPADSIFSTADLLNL